MSDELAARIVPKKASEHAIEFDAGSVNVRLSDAGTVERKGDEQNARWEAVPLSTEGGSATKTIVASVAALLDIVEWRRQRLAELDQRASASPTTSSEPHEREPARRYHEPADVTNVPPGQAIRQGILFPGGEYEVWMLDDNKAWLRHGKQGEWHRWELRPEVVGAVQSRTSNQLYQATLLLRDLEQRGFGQPQADTVS